MKRSRLREYVRAKLDGLETPPWFEKKEKQKKPEPPPPPRREKKKRGPKCECGICNKCKYRSRRKWFQEMRRKNLVGCGRKWNMAYAKDEVEEFLVRVHNDKDWTGPRPQPGSVAELWQEAALYPTGLPRCGRVGPKGTS